MAGLLDRSESLSGRLYSLETTSSRLDKQRTAYTLFTECQQQNWVARDPRTRWVVIEWLCDPQCLRR